MPAFPIPPHPSTLQDQLLIMYLIMKSDPCCRRCLDKDLQEETGNEELDRRVSEQEVKLSSQVTWAAMELQQGQDWGL